MGPMWDRSSEKARKKRQARQGKEMLEIQGYLQFVAKGGRTNGRTLGAVIISGMARAYRSKSGG